MTKLDLKKRFKDWAVQVVLFTRQYPPFPEFHTIRDQLIRSASSTAANYRAACRGKSGKDFINKLKIVEEEIDESLFWLEFSVALDDPLRSHVTQIYKEGNELLSIVVAAIKTTRMNLEKNS